MFFQCFNKCQCDFTVIRLKFIGYVAGDSKSNVVKNNSGVVQSNLGHAVYVYGSPEKSRETTAGPTVDLDSSVSGSAGGWEN